MDSETEKETEIQKGLNLLRAEVEKAIGHAVKTPADFDFLSDTLIKAGCSYVSATTLKRVWGYIHDAGPGYRPGNFTLRALCCFIGFSDFNSFLSGHANLDTQSETYLGNYIESRKLPLGSYISLTWAPNRRCTLHHIKETLFEVTEALHSKIKEGDMVECGCFTQNAPAYFSRVFRDGSAPMTYVAGSRSGIRFQIHETVNK